MFGVEYMFRFDGGEALYYGLVIAMWAASVVLARLYIKKI